MEGKGVEEREWIMTGVINIGAMLEYGRASSVVRRAVTAVQASPATSEAGEAASAMADEYPIPFNLTAQLMFAMLSHVLKHPAPKPSPSARSTLSISDLCPNISQHTLKTHRSASCPRTFNPLERAG
jgi:protein SMG6